MDTLEKKILWERLYKVARMTFENAPGCHDFDHTLRVLNNARRLIEMERPESPFVVEVAALLHDIARPEELASDGAVCHAELGAEKVKKILRESGCDDKKWIEQVSEAVRTHRYRSANPPKTLEAQIVYDADKLDSMGAFGVARAFHFAGRIGAVLHNTQERALGSASYSHEDSAYREYLVKLRYLHEKVLTSGARKLAQERSIFMRDFFERLNQEAGYPSEEEIQVK